MIFQIQCFLKSYLLPTWLVFPTFQPPLLVSAKNGTNVNRIVKELNSSEVLYSRLWKTWWPQRHTGLNSFDIRYHNVLGPCWRRKNVVTFVLITFICKYRGLVVDLKCGRTWSLQNPRYVFIQMYSPSLLSWKGKHLKDNVSIFQTTPLKSDVFFFTGQWIFRFTTLIQVASAGKTVDAAPDNIPPHGLNNPRRLTSPSPSTPPPLHHTSWTLNPNPHF